jgi:uncharacterized protein YhhL (DUF1145 family)
MKILTLIFWAIVLAASFQLIPSPFSIWLCTLGGLILVAHVVEYIVLFKKIKAKGDSSLKAFWMTMVFGVFYFNA